ncbi:E3 ubiquitin protein ligase RIE1 [Acorus gramineus]|uniref:RING-type E3 ubiquitin transferase n=1 Tax=Acorus gramineus TaxID=55184 RepID=A0AAV9BR10_ACOGR|nr:E3 ubiquitin protein ligase RIE1 [Acorus gramineus]
MRDQPATATTAANAVAEWGYSRPVVMALDAAWNLAFVLVSAGALTSTARERPSVPIRAWIVGYALHCLLHVRFTWVEYRRRGRGEAEWVAAQRRLETLTTMLSVVWWLLGFYWILVGGQTLVQDAPHLYWLTVVFLAFDLFFVVFCILLGCFIGIALCCCLPCVIAILYAMAGREGATEADISSLPRFKYRQDKWRGAFGADKQHTAVKMTDSNGDSMDDLVLPPEDSECCICLVQYEDGVALHSLQCGHHFHSGCIVKWLRINATCPLCKFNILKGDEHV